MDASNPTSYWKEQEDLHTISDRIALAGALVFETSPAVLETAALTITLHPMAPVLRDDRRPSGSESDVQTATPNRYMCRRSDQQTTAFTYIQLYHTLEQKF